MNEVLWIHNGTLYTPDGKAIAMRPMEIDFGSEAAAEKMPALPESVEINGTFKENRAGTLVLVVGPTRSKETRMRRLMEGGLTKTAARDWLHP